MGDIYFEKDYGKLYESIEGGKCEEFIFRSSLGEVRHLYIKKPVMINAVETGYFDLTTPYGYGGPVITKGCGSRNELVEQFHEAFQAHSKISKFISEFVRFHPIISNADDFSSCYETILKRKTTGTNLSDFEDPFQKEFSKSTRRNIRKALDQGVDFKVTVNPPSIKNFQEIYYSTMERNNAESIYFFDEEYFSNCLKFLGPHIVLTEAIYKGETIGMGLNFAYNNIINTHLSGTLGEYHHLSPAYILQYAIVCWGKENNYDLVHDGGGRTSDEDDKLYLFKKQFGKNTEFDYYVGHKVWNEEVYTQLYEAGVYNLE